jgi:rare lipoprotein A
VVTCSRIACVPSVLLVSACTLVGYPAGAPAAPAPVERERPAAGAPSAGRDSVPEVPPGAPDFRRDRPPTDPRDVDLDTISDAVPKAEALALHGNMPEYAMLGRVYRLLEDPEGYEEEGIASWYGEEFQGRLTSSGEPYDMYAMTAAHRTLPLPSYVEVTNLDNGKKVVVRVNDRGPFYGERLIDVSYAAAHRLGMLGGGTANVRIRVLLP